MRTARAVVATLACFACSSPSQSPTTQEIDAAEAPGPGDDAASDTTTPPIDAPMTSSLDAPAPPPPPPTCGDGVCAGNAGELCSTCATDCAKQTVTCGNGQCEAGESPGCTADCGPSPWTWASNEAQLATLINNARTQGFACPGSATVTRPAFIIDDSMKLGAREWVWELAHQNYFNNGNYCNGRTLAERKALGGNFTGYLLASGYTNVQMAFDSWMTSATLCPIVMSGVATRASIAIALDTANQGYILVMK
jgi:uncharacterized protein YkwD